MWPQFFPRQKFTAAALALALALSGWARADTYSAWKARVFSESEQADPAISGELALSPAGDGIPNLLKYAFEVDPHQDGSFALPKIGLSNVPDPITGEPIEYPTITYRVSSTDFPSDLYFVPEISVDLQVWVRGDAVFAAPTSQIGGNPGDPDLITYQARVPTATNAKTILRIRVLEGQTLPEDWQITNFGYTGVDPTGDDDLDGRSNFYEFLHGSDPHDYFDGRTPALEIVSGDRQRGFPSHILPFPLVVRVTFNGAVLANAPVRCSVSQGSGQVAASLVSLRQDMVDIATDANGLASVYLFLGSVPHETIVFEASSGGQSRSAIETSIDVMPPKVVAGDSQVAALDADRTVWLWGDNSYGQVGDGTYDLRDIPIQNATVRNIADIAAGTSHTIALQLDGSVWTWGSNGNGQLGDGTYNDRATPARVSSITGVIAISAGSYHTVAVKSDGTVWGWGYNGDGELGNGTNIDSFAPVQVVTESGAPLLDVVAIASGYNHTIALKADGSLWAWGANWSGGLGDGTNIDRHYAVQVVSTAALSASNLMDRRSSPQEAITFTAIRAGGYDSLGLVSDGTLLAWGANWFGQLGNDTFNDSNVPVPVAALTDVIDFAIGFSHSLALKSDGSVWGSGSNFDGEANGDPNSAALLTIAEQVAGVSSIRSVASGSSFSVALAANGLIYTWGDNSYGQLGVGSEESQTGPVPTSRDSNHSGMPDWWQLEHFGHLGVDGSGDEDNDGLTNAQEYLLETDPSNSDTDGDGALDGADGWATDPDLHPPRLPEFSYAVVDLGEGAARAINNNNEIVGDNGNAFIWRNGIREELPERGDETTAVAINDGGKALFNFEGAKPAIWSVDHFVEIKNGGDSQGTVIGWDPNIDEQGANPPFVVGLNNFGHVSGTVVTDWSFSALNRSWPIIWKASYSQPILLFAPPDANDQILDVDDVLEHGFFRDHNQTSESHNFGGHYDNRRGLDNIGVVSAINNADQVVGACYHSEARDPFGFPVPAYYLGTSPAFYGEVILWTNDQPETVAQGTYKGAQSLNDDAVIVGRDFIYDESQQGADHTVLWIKVDKQWKEKDLGIADENEVRRINRNLQIISQHVLYQNGHAVPLNTRIPSNCANFRAFGINEAGLIVGQADIESGGAILHDHAVLLVPAALVVDWNRDGTIDETDQTVVTRENPYRFWINDDNDSGETGGDDIPVSSGASSALPDYQTNITGGGSFGPIDGVRDLIDFFPIFLDIRNLTQMLSPEDGFVYKLRHADSAVNFVETSLTTDNVGSFLRDVATAREIAGGTVQQVSAGEARLSESFLASIQEEGHGVILLEGRAESDKPLVLEVTAPDGSKLAEISFPLRLSGVEKMFRHFNMIAAGGVGRYTEMSEPGNYPDSLCNGKSFVFVHGFYVDPDSARGWNAETFKRMYWSGSNARFVGVTWNSDETNGTTVPDYHKNVDNAFATAQSFASLLYYLGPRTTVAAHSLGNIVVGSAIQDWGATPANYFMIDAAVPLEAYDGATLTDDAMIHPDWIDYRSATGADHPVPDRAFASEWHLDPAFTSGDARKPLSWRDRLDRVGANTYNFYSSSEEVLRRHEGDPSSFEDTVWEQIFHAGIYTWCLQEKLKGRQVDINIGIVHGKLGSTYGGWHLSTNFHDFPNSSPHSLTPTEAAGRTDESLLTEPIFDPGFYVSFDPPSPDGRTRFVRAGAPEWIIDLTDPTKGSATAQAHGNQLLAEMFPARTLPAGANIATQFGNAANFNMPLLYRNDWPQERGDNNDWRHSDFKIVAHTYVYALYRKFVATALLDQ